MAIPLTFLEPARGIRLAKTITSTGSTPYPLAKRFTSHTLYLEPAEAGVREAFAAMQAHAIRGHAIHKGVLKQPLSNEPRKGKADLNAPTNLLVIDIDDFLPLSPLPDTGITAMHLRDLTVGIRNLLPAPLNSTACIANASASTGHKSGGVVGLHLFFLLDQPVAPSQLTHWLTSMNFDVGAFADQVSLNRSGMSLKYPVDPVVARNAQIIYIAPPSMEAGITSAFVSDEDRWVLVEGSNWTCDITQTLSDIVPAVVQKNAEEKLSSLRKSLGLKKITPRYRRLEVNGERLQVMTNPDHMQMTLIRTTDQYAYWNINGGDSNAYYNPIGNPEIIYNFKGEPPFELSKANPDVYDWYCETYKTNIRETSDPRPLVFREQATDQHYAIEYNPREDLILRINKIARQNIPDWTASYGVPEPDPLPQWDLTFNPASNLVIDWENQILNTFQPSNLLRNPPAILPTYANCKVGEAAPKMEQLCPYIHKVLYHICGASDLEYEWFMNWLAFTMQTRKKAQTAWIFSGVPGTGKGVFFERILRPLIGDRYATRKRIDHLEEQFNAYLEETLFLVYDEFRLADSRSDDRLLNKLKDDITAETANIRAMRTDTIEKVNFTNYIFFSNHHDVMRIEEGDRRFNVAPPQLQPLRVAWPNISEELGRLDDELGTFAGFLLSYDACERSARSCIKNDAKNRMKEVAMSYNQRFCLALRQGEIDYFVDVFDMDIANDLTKSTLITTAQKHVRHWLENIDGPPMRIASSALFTVFLALHDVKNMTQTKMTQMLRRNDVPVSRAKIGGSTVSCVQLAWTTELSEDDIATLIKPQKNQPAHKAFH